MKRLKGLHQDDDDEDDDDGGDDNSPNNGCSRQEISEEEHEKVANVSGEWVESEFGVEWVARESREVAKSNKAVARDAGRQVGKDRNTSCVLMQDVNKGELQPHMRHVIIKHNNQITHNSHIIIHNFSIA